MEITSQIANLEDEVKLLKGEIKSVLKEIRAAVLSQDNPFATNTMSLGPARAIPAPAAEPPATLVFPIVAEPPPVQQAPAPVPFPSTHQAGDAPAQIETRREPPPIFQGDDTSRAHATNEPVRAQSERSNADEPPDPSDQRPSLLTIASLLAWVEDTLVSLGPRRFRLTLELAYFAELLSPEVRDVLRDLPQFWPEADEPERPVSVNECLLVLRQLEAILQGERVTRLPRRRARRHAQ
jgi:hypothetical protein